MSVSYLCQLIFATILYRQNSEKMFVTVIALKYALLVNRGTMGVNSLPKTVTRQRRDLNPGLLRLTPAC